MLKKIIISLSILCSSFAYSQVSNCDNKFPFGKPVHFVKDTTGLCRIGYYSEHNNEYKIPLYVAEYLLKEKISGVEKRTNDFRPDISVPEHGRSYPKDYAYSGYDQGHNAPAGDMGEDTAAMKQSFYMSNMFPQVPRNNRGIWKALEIQIRNWTVTRGELYVYTGSIVGDNYIFIGNNVAIPETLYKIVIDKKINECIAFVIPNSGNTTKKIFDYRASCDEAKKLSKIDFYPGKKFSLIGTSFMR